MHMSFFFFLLLLLSECFICKLWWTFSSCIPWYYHLIYVSPAVKDAIQFFMLSIANQHHIMHAVHDAFPSLFAHSDLNGPIQDDDGSYDE